MVTLLWFTVVLFIFVVLLILTSVAATISASSLYASNDYKTNIYLQMGHYYMSVASAIGWICFVVLVLGVVIGYLKGGFSYEDISSAILNKKLTKEDVNVLMTEEKKISDTQIITTSILVTLCVTLLSTFATGVLSIMGTIQIASSGNNDSNVGTAYTYGIVASVSGVGTVLLSFICVLLYYGFKYAQEKKAKEINKIVKK